MPVELRPRGLHPQSHTRKTLNPVLLIVKAVIGVAAWPVADLVARASSRCWDEGAGLPARAGEKQVNMAFARAETVQMWPTSDVKHE